MSSPSTGPSSSPKTNYSAELVRHHRGKQGWEAPAKGRYGRSSRKISAVPGRIAVAEDGPNHPVTGIIHIRNPDAASRLLSLAAHVTLAK